ncbi:MAG: AraC family transcriptional regulator [Prevotellaceae bacterium]|jgi:YesN/AraC family two-component response regulator|nr:AraC family transcriptional regulator [Prevotellaceae bacterium]
MENIKEAHLPGENKDSMVFNQVHVPWNKPIKYHQQNHWMLLYIITGRGVRMIGGTVDIFIQGEIFLIPPDVPNSWSFDKYMADKERKVEYITVFFSPEILENSPAVFPELSDVMEKIRHYTDAMLFHGSASVQLQRVLTAMIQEDRIQRLLSLIKIFILLASTEAAVATGDAAVDSRNAELLQRVYLFIKKNYKRNILTGEMAAFIGMSQIELCTFLKRITGKPFLALLIEYRVIMSCQMLLKTNLTAAEIGYASGFRNMQHYNRMFKEHTGMTPLEYRYSKR